MQIELHNKTTFDYRDRNEPFAQRQLRRSYIQDDQTKATCLCNPDTRPTLLIAYRRREDAFELRKWLNSDPKLHSIKCPFRLSNRTGRYCGDNGLTLTIPVYDQLNVTDHDHARAVLNALWNELTDEGYISPDKSIRWRNAKEEIRTVAEDIDINQNPLVERLSVVVPKPKEHLTTLDLPIGRVVVCELNYANENRNNESIAISAKGVANTIWLNAYHVYDLIQSQRELLLARKNEVGEHIRRILLMTLVNTTGDNSNLLCNAVAIVKVDRNSFMFVDE